MNPAPRPQDEAAPARRQALPSLRQKVLRSVLPPLAASWIAATFVALGIAQLFAQRAFDRSLLDDAYLLATHVHINGGNAELRLSERELNTVLFDQAETVYFSIRDDKDQLIAGHGDLRMAPSDPEDGYRLATIVFEGQLLRAVTLHRETPLPFEVQVAQTTTARDALVRQLLMVSLLPQLLLLLLLAWWLGRTIHRATLPLVHLEEAVENRSADDLRPVESEAVTHDVATLADAINSLLQRLQRNVQAQREFSGNVAHELRTPLAGIRALAEYGLAQSDPALWRQQLEAIRASEARASILVDKLLALAMAGEAETRLQLSPLRLDEVVRDAVLRFLPRADAAGVDLGAHGIDEPMLALGDRALVEGILNNLIDNALRYGIAPDGASTVTVSLARQDEAVVLTVEDNGPGAPQQSQLELAVRGSRGEAAQLFAQGAGLGLALVAQYARLMKGHMTLSGGPGGRGWRCAVRLPAAPADSSATPPA